MIRLLSALLLTLLAQTASAAQVYIWKDEKGVTHMTDHPQNKAATSQEIKVQTKAPAADPIQTERLKSMDEQLKSYEDERTARKKREAKIAEEQAKQQQLCSKAKRGKALYQQQARLVTINEQGERHYLSDAERAGKLAELDKAEAEHCQ